MRLYAFLSFSCFISVRRLWSIVGW